MAMLTNNDGNKMTNGFDAYSLITRNEEVRISITDIFDDLFPVFHGYDHFVSVLNAQKQTAQDKALANSMFAKYQAKLRERKSNRDDGKETYDYHAATTSLIWSFIGSYRFAYDNDLSQTCDYITDVTGCLSLYMYTKHQNGLRNAAIRAYRNRNKTSSYEFGLFNLPTLTDINTLFSNTREELEYAEFVDTKSDLEALSQMHGLEGEAKAKFLAGTHNTYGDPIIGADEACVENLEADLENAPNIKSKLLILERYRVHMPELGKRIGAARRKFRDDLESNQTRSIGTAWASIVPQLIPEPHWSLTDELGDSGFWFLVKLERYLTKKMQLWSLASLDFANMSNLSGLNPREGTGKETIRSLPHSVMYERRAELAGEMLLKIDNTLYAWNELRNEGPDSYSVSKEEFGDYKRELGMDQSV